MAKPRGDRPNWRDVLIVTGGMTPQVVTETLYALATRTPNPVIPAKIICAVTKGVADGFGSAFKAALKRLKLELGIRADWDRPARNWRRARTGLFVAFPVHADGRPVTDIRTDEDAALFGNFISEIVRVESADAKARLHLSLAGGRKTMSFHGGAAMSLFGRIQDELSHVLVHPADFEGCADFWFPTGMSCPIKHRDGRMLDSKDARVELANIPYLRVRDRIPRRLLTHAMDYQSYVVQTNAALGRVPLFLELTTADQRVQIGNIIDFTLPNTEFALYQLMAEWKRDKHKGASSVGIGTDHAGWLTAHMFENPETYSPNPVKRFKHIYDDTFKTGTRRPTKLLISENPATYAERKTNVERLREWKSKLIEKLHEHIHLPDLADRFGAPLSEVEVRVKRVFRGRERTVRVVVFGLRLLPEEITIRAG